MTARNLHEEYVPFVVSGGGELHGEIFLREPYSYLRKKIQGSKKTTENSEGLDRRVQMCSKPVPPVLQF